MRKYAITRLLAGATLASVGACNGQLAVDDQHAGDGASGGSPPANTASGGAGGGTEPARIEHNPPPDVPTQGSSVNAASCPSSMPEDESTCDVAEGQYCTYLYRMEAEDASSATSQSCGCWLASGGTKRWDCGIPEPAYLCPDAQPQTGADCFGARGVECNYPPTTTCDCTPTSANSDTMTWQCESNTVERGSPSGPAGLDPTTPVAALTDAQRAAWCGWYADAWQGPGAPDVADRVDENGYTTLNGFTVGSSLECLACVPKVSKAGCAANLSFSTCEAPIGALTDCVLTVLDVCAPAPHGCAPYFDAPNCDGTIVVSGPAHTKPTSGSSCSLRVQ